MSRDKVSQRRRHNEVTGAAATAAVNTLAPTVVVLSEQAYAGRAERRHAVTENGGRINVAKGRQPPALNEPYRKPRMLE